jgi:hypothetical protein
MRASPAQSLTLSFFARPYLELESVREDDPRFTQPGRPGTALLGREPEHLAVEIMDYLDWRGITVTCPQMWYHFLC